ncbi:MAG TPA: amidohydrolase family protein [Flavisolibacter sp.]|nr:amidohydrolase family protein [Flavisolibacter sp.]
MKTIDAHQHFWQFDPVRDSWITDDMLVIQKDFFPDDLKPVLQQNGFDGCVAVQASQSEEETDFLISLANENDFIKGVVGWVDLQANDIEERLAKYKSIPVVKGFRHVLQGEPQRDLMLKPEFKRGIAALQKHGFTYDILIFPDQVNFSGELVASFPEQKFVIDHIAKPYITRKEIDEWKRDMQKIAKQENVYCKISGMVTEADWKGWKKEDFKPYLDAVVEAFGTDRILFGSDWPVCLVAASYEKMLAIVKDYFASFSQDEQDRFFGLNAIRFYNL